jgi:hypothetical protein
MCIAQWIKSKLQKRPLLHLGTKTFPPHIVAENITPNLEALIELTANGSRNNPVWVQFDSAVDRFHKDRIYLADITSFSAVEIDTESYRNQAIQYWYNMQSEVKNLLKNQPELREVFLLDGQIDATSLMQ